ncbi:CapA family protein [uncultured Mesotoga sp.]|uniref:CapA family protein n=1 Tax=uncultured Mesotoga sp. TaxID=1184400 RepID=UPI002599F305|nr:CapA family protein [uncultured Mesotoga sp.]
MNSKPTIGFCGDVMLARGFLKALKSRVLDSVLSENLLRRISNLDYLIANLETPICSGNKNSGDFFMPPDYAELLTHFDCMSLANNHIFDCGETGVVETIATLNKLNIGFTGICSHSKDLCYPRIIASTAGNISVIGCIEDSLYPEFAESSFSILKLSDLLNSLLLNEFEEREDIVANVVLLHAGNEFTPFPSRKLVESARNLVGKGADLVMISHSHFVSGFERIAEGGMIFYGLGDFIFDVPVSGRKTSVVPIFEISRNGLSFSEILFTKKSSDLTVNLVEDKREIRKLHRKIEKYSKLLSNNPEALRIRALSKLYVWNYQLLRIMWMIRSKGFKTTVRFLLDVLKRAVRKTFMHLRGKE